MAWMRDDFDREGGVTYVGARSFVAAFAIVCAVFVGIAFGASRIDTADGPESRAVVGAASTPLVVANPRAAALTDSSVALAPLRPTAAPAAVPAAAVPAAVSAPAAPAVVPPTAAPAVVRATAAPAVVRATTVRIQSASAQTRTRFARDGAAQPVTSLKHAAAVKPPEPAVPHRAIVPLASAALSVRGTLAPRSAPAGFLTVRTPPQKCCPRRTADAGAVTPDNREPAP